MLRGPLSDENAQKTLDELRAVVEPETARDLARWGKSSTLFITQMANLRDFVSGRAEVVKNGAAARQSADDLYSVCPRKIKAYVLSRVLVFADYHRRLVPPEHNRRLLRLAEEKFFRRHIEIRIGAAIYIYYHFPLLCFLQACGITFQIDLN